jgi:DNA (cytosine-5)-methyltransferase 1
VKHASLFSGIGGFDLAAQWMGWENVFQVEIDGFCQKVLEKNFPNVTRYGDIKQFDGAKYRGTVDVLSGGDPCQPHSTAGANRGLEDYRYLWPEYFRIIKTVGPSFVVNENVSGSISNWILDQKIVDLETAGYTCWPPLLIPAGAQGSIHRRDRIWLVAYSNAIRPQAFSKQLGANLEEEANKSKSTSTINSLSRQVIGRGQEEELFTDEPPMVRTDHGIPKELDAIAALGNAIVPQVAFEIFKAIEQVIG